MLDDIQFLLNKEGTVSEFFHTFNALYESGKQIVLTSDRSPNELDMDNRLISRFEQGMFTDIKHPDFETRLAILKEKSKKENINLPEDVLEYVAKIITDNIRKLQGALTRLMAQSSIYKIDIDLPYAQTILNEYYKLNEKIVDINKIQQITANYFNISITDMLSTTRTKDITLARQIAMYLCRDLTELSLPTIGKAFGGRDHTTVIHSCNKIQEKLSQEPGFRQQINELSGKILH